MSDSCFNARSIPDAAHFSVQHLRDGWPIRCFDWPATAASRGGIMMLGGRGDIAEKYLETFAHWHDRRWSVATFDWRGQGGSGRLGRDPMVGHIKHFSDWIDDLAEIYTRWTNAQSGPHVVVAHSMGGHLALRALIEQRIAPTAIVLTSPMFGFDTGRLPLGVATFMARMLAALGPDDRAAWKQNEKPTAAWNSRQTYLTSDANRYADEIWWKQHKPEIDIGPPSWRWLLEAQASMLKTSENEVLERAKTPMLIIGTQGDKLVSPAAIEGFAARLPNAELFMFDANVAHEILRESDEVRGKALALIDAFLEKYTAPC